MTSSSYGPGSINPSPHTQLYGVRTTKTSPPVYWASDYISSYYQQKIIPRFYADHEAYNNMIYLTNLSSPLWRGVVSMRPWVFVKSEDNLLWFMENPSPHRRTSPMTPLLHKLCTRAKSQLLCGEDTYDLEWGQNKEVLVTRSRHVVRGVLVDKKEDKPLWFVEKELEGLFL